MSTPEYARANFNTHCAPWPPAISLCSNAPTPRLASRATFFPRLAGMALDTRSRRSATWRRAVHSRPMSRHGLIQTPGSLPGARE
jgi:hypothetical protein